MTGLRRRVAGLLDRPLLRDTLRLQAGQVLVLGLHAARSLLALRWVGPSGFGMYALAQSIVTTALLADVTAANRVALVGAARALGDERGGDAGGPLADFVRLSVAAAVVLCAALWWLAPVVAAPAFHQVEVGDYAGWLGLCLVVDIPFNLLIVALQAGRRMTATVVAETIRAGAWLIATVAALSIHSTATALVAAQVGLSVVACCAAVVAYARIAGGDPRLPGWGALLRRSARRRSGPALASGFRIAVDKNLGNLAGQLPVLLLGTVDSAAVGYLAAALRVMGLPGPLLTGLARNLDAVLPARAAAGIEDVRSTFVRATRLAALGWIPVTIVTALLSPFILVRILGAAYTPALVLIPALALQSLALGAGVAMGAAFRTLDRVGWSIACQIAALAVTTPVGFWLVHHHGASGAAWFHALRVWIFTALALAAAFHLLRPTPADPAAAS